VNKLTILLAHAYGVVIEPQRLIHTGIQNLQTADAIFAKEKGYAIKLVAYARKLASGEIAAFVLPQFVEQECRLFGIHNEYNGVIIESSLADKQFFCGKGAGGYPTASAVLSDLSALRYNYRYEYKKLQQRTLADISSDFYLHVSISFEGGTTKRRVELDQVYEWSRNEFGLRLSGIIHSSKLATGDWWKQPGVSLIVYPQAVTTDFAPVYAVPELETELA
jgi:homoserine dehydrogenase